MVAGRLGSAGYSVLVLEAGGPTQRSLGGASSGAGHWTVFDVPLGWLQVRARVRARVRAIARARAKVRVRP